MDDVRTALSEGRIDLPRTGEVRAGDRPSPPYVVVDADGTEVEAISKYLRDLALGDASSLTCRSYAHDLLRWWRLLEVVSVSWERATTSEVILLVGWLRAARNPQRRRSSGIQPGAVNLRTGKAALPEGYAPSTINHALSVLSGFYAFHAHYGRGPAVNPVLGQQGHVGGQEEFGALGTLHWALRRQDTLEAIAADVCFLAEAHKEELHGCRTFERRSVAVSRATQKNLLGETERPA